MIVGQRVQVLGDRLPRDVPLTRVAAGGLVPAGRAVPGARPKPLDARSGIAKPS